LLTERRSGKHGRSAKEQNKGEAEAQIGIGKAHKQTSNLLDAKGIA
jgi:hypothetical protein